MTLRQSNMRLGCSLVLGFAVAAGIIRANPPDSKSPSADPAASAELAELLGMLEARKAAGEGGLQWKFTFEQFTVPMPDVKDYAAALERRAADPLKGAEKVPKVQCSGTVKWQPSTNRYLFSVASVDQWHGGAADYVGTRTRLGFDGKRYWTLTTTRVGDELPDESLTGHENPAIQGVPIGTIGRQTPRNGPLQLLSARSGFEFRPRWSPALGDDHWTESVDIAGFLRELARTRTYPTVSRKGKPLHVAFLVPDKKFGHPLGKGTTTLTFNMEQKGTLERVTYYANGPGGRAYRNWDYAILNAEVTPGVWFPKEILWGNWMNPLVWRIRISDVEPVKGFQTADFQVEFPDDTHIDPAPR